MSGHRSGPDCTSNSNNNNNSNSKMASSGTQDYYDRFEAWLRDNGAKFSMVRPRTAMHYAHKGGIHTYIDPSIGPSMDLSI
jgi:hypothetical protein